MSESLHSQSSPVAWGVRTRIHETLGCGYRFGFSCTTSLTSALRVPFAHPSDIVFQTCLIRPVASDQKFTVFVQVCDEGFYRFVEPRELLFTEGARKGLEDGDSSRVRSFGAVTSGSDTHHQDKGDHPPGNAYACPDSEDPLPTHAFWPLVG